MCQERCEKHGERCNVTEHHPRPTSPVLYHDHNGIGPGEPRHSWETPILRPVTEDEEDS